MVLLENVDTGGIFLQRLGLLLAALVVMVVVVTGCIGFRPPADGKWGPSWELPVQVPLVYGEYSLGETVYETGGESFTVGEFKIRPSEIIDITQKVGDALDSSSYQGDIEAELQIEGVLELSAFNIATMTVESGTLCMEPILPHDNLSLTDVEVTLNGQLLTEQLPVQDGKWRFNLAGEFSGDNPVVVSGTLTGNDIHMDADDEIGVRLSFDELTLTEVSGEIPPTTVTVSGQESSIDLRQDASGVSIDSATIELTVHNDTGGNIDLSGLIISANAAGGSEDLTLDSTVVAPGPPTTISLGNVRDFLNTLLRPDSTISFGGDVGFGGGDEIVTLSSSDTFTVSLAIKLPVSLEFPPEGLEIGDPEIIALDENLRERLASHVGSPRLYLRVDNGIGVGICLQLKFAATKAALSSVPDRQIVEFVVDPGSTWEDGYSQVAEVTPEVIDLLATDGEVYVQPVVRIFDRDGGPVTINAGNIRYSAYLQFTTSVNK